ncbi:MAG: hypothetical protein H6509_00340 [Bryobacterales bacterium]|nr:hypothetical protein [Bryobacterales bacterium]
MSIIGGLMLSIVVMTALNWFGSLTLSWCADCNQAYGLPFSHYRESGFAGGDTILWWGAAGNAVITLIAGIGLSWVIEKASQKLKR